MTTKEKLYIQILRSLEPEFKRASKIAFSLQHNTILNSKAIGNEYADAITDADFKIQEIILNIFLKTELKDCRLIAEENTESVKKFSSQGNIFLTVDPIDGTKLYAEGSKYFSTIVGLHGSSGPIYTFIYFPAMEWCNIFYENSYEVTGNPEPIALTEDLSKTIVFSFGEPKKVASDIYNKLTKDGFVFRPKSALTNKAGSTALLLSGRVAGLYSENPPIIDGLVGLHYARANRYPIYMNLDLKKIDAEKNFYPGYYIVIKND